MAATLTRTQVNSLADLIAFRGRETSDKTAFHFQGDKYTFGHIFKKAKEVAGFLSQKGIGRHDRVIFLIPNSPEFFYGFYGALLLGATAVPLFPGTAPERNIRVAGLCGASCLVLPSNTSEDDLDEFRKAGREGQLPVFTINEAEEGPSLEVLPTIEPHELAFLQFTSGSTGDPKGVMLTHGCLLDNVQQMIQGMAITEKDVFVSWLPTYHDMGLILKTIAPFFIGAELVLLPTSLSNVRAWLKAIQEYGGTFTAAPDFAYRLCLRYIREPGAIDISSLRVALNAAEPVRLRTIQAFEKAFGLKNVMTAGYGLAEATVGVSMSAPGEPVKSDERGLVSVGRVFPDIECKIRDDAGKPAASGTIGRITVKSISNCRGYFNNPKGTEDLFIGDGYLDTGDMGYLDDEDCLYIAGRRKNVIITGGKTIANQEIEETVDQHPAVKLCAAVGVDRDQFEGEQAFVFAEIRNGSKMTTEALEDITVEIVRDLHTKLGFRPGRVYLVKGRTIPKTYNGKLQHAALKQAYLSGELRAKGLIYYPDY